MDAEADSFLGQQPSPQQRTPATSSFQGFSTPLQSKSTPLATSSFASSTPQQSTQAGPKHFTMAGSGKDVDHFLTPSTRAPSTFTTPSYGSQPPFSQYAVSTSSQQTSASTSQPSGIPQGTPLGPSHLPSRRVYPKVNQQIGYSQPMGPQATTSQLPPQINPSMPSYPAPTQFPAQPLYTQGSQPTMMPQVNSQTPFMTSNPQPPPQTYLPAQGTQQYGATQFPQQTNQAPVLPVEQQFSPSTSPEGVVPTSLIAPVQPHWFYLKENRAWLPFSYIDSDCLEHSYRLPDSGEDRIVPTDGGRYDVNLDKRTREPVYWEEPATVVRRCTWFYKGEGGTKLVPYEEDLAERFEVGISYHD